MRHIVIFTIRIFIIFVLPLSTFSCCPPYCPDNDGDSISDVAETLRDDDNDGWFTNETNQRVSLILEEVEFPNTGDVLIDYWITIDDVRFPLTGNLVTIIQTGPIRPNIEMATRTVGSWLLLNEDHLIEWGSSIDVSARGLPIGGRGTITWNNREKEIKKSISMQNGHAELTFHTRIEKFPDPSPNDAEGDSDLDGIHDSEEAALAESSIGIGDPASQDILLVVGYTHSDWKMTPLSKTLLRSVFLRHDINFYIVDTQYVHAIFDPGRMTHRTEFLPRDFRLSLNNARDMRDTYIRLHARNYAHLLILAEKLSPDAFGWAEKPGRNLVVKSHLPILGPDFHEYQAKSIMHEIGHNFGLCHPTESNSTCISGGIPVDERNPGESVMGAPMEDDGDQVAQLIHALERPMDYSPTQWENLRLRLVR